MAKRIYMIAGEASGDQLGGMLVQEMRTLDDTIEYRGIGGFSMMQQGIASLFPMRELSIMGFAEIVPHLLSITARIRQTVIDIERFKPDILLTIDSPGFNYRVVKQLRKRGVHMPKCVHYVAPTVWAYKPERAQVTAELFDHLLCLLPFEPPYFEGKMPVDFVGHPMAWWWRSKGIAEGFRARHHIQPDVPLVALFPGSRVNELKHHVPIFRVTIKKMLETVPNLHATIYVREDIAQDTYTLTRNWPCPLTLCSDQLQKKQLFAASTVAIAKSGTISLECALAGLPSVTVYKASAISAWYVRRKIKTPYVHLANILANRMVIPELLQEHCTPDEVAKYAVALLNNATSRDAQISALSHISSMLGTEGEISPSMRAAKIVLNYLS